jgi:hypothetical protein
MPFCPCSGSNLSPRNGGFNIRSTSDGGVRHKQDSQFKPWPALAGRSEQEVNLDARLFILGSVKMCDVIVNVSYGGRVKLQKGTYNGTPPFENPGSR